MSDAMLSELAKIISQKAVKTVFQPIISLRDGVVLGYEALSRITCKSRIRNTDALFTLAGKEDRLWELEILCRTIAFDTVVRNQIVRPGQKLFVNVNPNIMHDKAYQKGLTRDMLELHGIRPESIVFEITEREAIGNMASFISAVENYKSQDYQIAIDDAGAGYSGLNLINDIAPDFIKLDMKLIRDINRDNLKYALVKGMIELSRIAGIFLIAEGIETCEEMSTLISLGVQYGQGYFIQHPKEQIEGIRSEVLQAIEEFNRKKNFSQSGQLSNIYIEKLNCYTDITGPDVPVQQIYNHFVHHPDCFGMCVLEDGKPAGIVTRDKLTLALSGYYGFTLHQKKPISQLMDREFMSVDHKMPISAVSSIAMSRSNDRLYDFIVVTKEGRYIGTVTVRDLLQKSTEIEIAAARHQNPLSGLPGNMVIEQKLSECLRDGNPFSVAYFDIDNFKAYNDVYGFEQGDQIIKLLADILSGLPDRQFVGHVGGDDFVIIAPGHLGSDDFEEITKRFEREMFRYYSDEDVRKGYIETLNRQGESERFPLTGLTVVVGNNKAIHCDTVSEFTEKLAKMKKTAKQKRKLMQRGA